jgi:hypothetical protein
MSVPKSALLAFLALAWFPSYGVAGDAARSRSGGSQVVIEKARSCDDSAAITLSPLTNETAEEVAKAAFEECRPFWTSAAKLYAQEHSFNISAQEATNDPVLMSLYFSDLVKNPEETVEKWKQSEIDKLRLLVMEARLKPTPTQ